MTGVISMSESRKYFEASHLPHLGRLSGSALMLFRDPRLAADLVVRAYGVAYRNWRRKRSVSTVSKNLFRALTDSYYRHLSTRDATSSTGGGGRAIERSGAATLRDDLKTAVRNLPEDIRPAAVLYYAARFTSREVAEILGKQRELTTSMIRRSRELLTESLPGGVGGGACQEGSS